MRAYSTQYTAHSSFSFFFLWFYIWSFLVLTLAFKILRLHVNITYSPFAERVRTSPMVKKERKKTCFSLRNVCSLMDTVCSAGKLPTQKFVPLLALALCKRLTPKRFLTVRDACEPLKRFRVGKTRRNIVGTTRHLASSPGTLAICARFRQHPSTACLTW